MNNFRLNLIVDDSRWPKQLPELEALCQAACAAVSESEAVKPQTTLPLSINLSLSNDETVHKLNLEFRGLDKSTNVLSFANIDDPDFELQPMSADSLELGDIIIALETLQREADVKGISLSDHLSHLLVHGLLHLLGYDHQQENEAEQMEKLEILILKSLNIANPYQE